jgi:hypothetical protein
MAAPDDGATGRPLSRSGRDAALLVLHQLGGGEAIFDAWRDDKARRKKRPHPRPHPPPKTVHNRAQS